MLGNWLGYIIVGKLLIYLIMQFPLPDFLKKIKTIEKLHSCDLCLGVWVYAPLAFLFGVDVLSLFGLSHYPILGGAITGGTLSFIVHIFSLGLKSKFEIVRL